MPPADRRSTGPVAAAELAALPPDRVPNRRDWSRLSRRWAARIDQRIAELERLKGGLTECIGTLGARWKVQAAADLVPVDIAQAELPDHTEQDIIVVDFEPALRPGLPPVTWPPEGQRSFYQSKAQGVLDFRPRVAVALRRDWQRIFDHGGIFCVFAEQPWAVEYIYGEQSISRISHRDETEMRLWEMLEPLAALRVTSDLGSDIRPTDAAEGVKLAEHLSGKFACTIEPTGDQAQRWLPFAQNRWGKAVAGLLLGEGDQGAVVVLPQLDDKASAVEWLVKELAPRVRPALLPDIEKGRWRQEPALELAPVRELRAELAEVRERASERRASASDRGEVEQPSLSQ